MYYSHPSNRNPKTFLFHKSPKNPLQAGFLFWFEKLMVLTIQDSKMLVRNLKGFWHYRVGHYRIICRIEDEELIIVAVNGGHRKDVYKK
ncbi:type II toxin-antitoxin system RelE/ParE family toxin [Streptococcus mutans]|nr:type II toxin-antitoxin system RelE/ParE family toxin [Streptococcus mutans]